MLCNSHNSLIFETYLWYKGYEDNIQAQSEETLKASIVATVLCGWMDLYPEGVWQGAPSHLYDELCQYADDQNISTRQKAWPKTAHWLIRRLNVVKPSLHAAGYIIETDRSSKSRLIRITSGNAVNTVTGDTSDSNDGKNSKLGDFS